MAVTSKLARSTTNRRNMKFKTILWGILVLAYLGCSKEKLQLVDKPIDLNFLYGAEANPTGSPIGGAQGYLLSPKVGNYHVSTKQELLQALNQAVAGETILVKDGTQIDLSGESDLLLNTGVTLAGNRGEDGSEGPLLYTNDMPTDGKLFSLLGQTRISGLRIRGPAKSIGDLLPEDQQYARIAIVANEPDIEIDNCEISHFDRGGIEIYPDGQNVYIHHNYLHDIQAYPVIVLNRSKLPILIEANIIEWVWHAVAGSGYPGTGYEARFNRFIRKAVPIFWLPYTGDHALDMHPYLPILQERNYRLAGQKLEIHHNTFINEAPGDPSALVAPDIKIRGIPTELARIYNNKFLNSDPAQAVVHYQSNVWVYNNLYGKAEQLIPVAEETGPQIIFHSPPPVGLEVPLIEMASLPIEIEVNMFEGLKVNDFQIWLNDKLIFEGVALPKSGEISLSESLLAQLGPGVHQIRVILQDDRQVNAEQMTFFRLN